MLLASTLLACFSYWLWLPSTPSSGWARARFAKVKKGMSREEVNRTVGLPSGNYLPGVPRTEKFGLEDNPRKDWWIGDNAYLIVEFDDTDTAIEVDLGQVGPPRPLTQRIRERIRRWLGL
jgi:hypothetical protein